MLFRSMVELEEINKLTQEIIDIAIEVYQTLGPGREASAYQDLLSSALSEAGFKVKIFELAEVDGETIHLESGDSRIFLIEDQVVIAVKSVNQLTQSHRDELISNMKRSGFHVGLLINFNVKKIEDGIKRLINY